MSAATWANLGVLVRDPPKYVSPEERQRQERVAVGRICGCGSCYCCEEFRRAATGEPSFVPTLEVRR